MEATMINEHAEFNVVEDAAFTGQHEYDYVAKTVIGLASSGLLARLNGQCVAAAEIIQNTLESAGYRSKMVECQALVTHPSGAISLVGYDHVGEVGSNFVDTHFVVVVECPQPILVDISIGHAVTGPLLAIVAPLSAKGPEILAEIEHRGFKIDYRLKKRTRHPQIHQKNLAHRIAEEAKTRQELGVVKTLVLAAVAVGAINFCANTVLIFLRFVMP
jgi:hypothetical protein